MTESSITLDASGIYYRDLNIKLKEMVSAGARHIDLNNVCGQRYIGTNLSGQVELHIHGTPGNDLGAFMDGPDIIVHGNAQDGCGNTMNNGRIVVHGRAGDVAGLSMRGGKVFIRDDVGYRAGIHMKEYQEKKPALIIGGTAQDFLGEYMAGGILAVLGLNMDEQGRHKAKFIGTGMHGGVIYIRGSVEDYQLGKEVGVADMEEQDYAVLRPLIKEFASYFEFDPEAILDEDFRKLYPRWLRPYGTLYAY